MLIILNIWILIFSLFLLFFSFILFSFSSLLFCLQLFSYIFFLRSTKIFNLKLKSSKHESVLYVQPITKIAVYLKFKCRNYFFGFYFLRLHGTFAFSFLNLGNTANEKLRAAFYFILYSF